MHRILAAVALLLPLLAAGAGAAPNPTGPVLLRDHVVTQDDVVRLGDLFEGLGENGAVAIARAPEPGRRVEVNARWLAAVAQAYGVAWRPGSRFDRAVIERTSQVVDIQRIEAAMRQALAERGVAPNASLQLDNPALRLHLPSDADNSLAIGGLSYDPASGRFAAYVVAPAQGAPLARATVTGRAVEMTEIPTLTRRVEPGEVIGRRDIEWIAVRADRLGRSTATEASGIVGKSPRRPIRPGEAVLSGDLRDPVLVSKNSLVTIRLETERMVLTAQGRALDQGAEGEVVRVMNTKSNKIINAAVVGSGQVRVVAARLGGINQEAAQ